MQFQIHGFIEMQIRLLSLLEGAEIGTVYLMDCYHWLERNILSVYQLFISY